MEIIAYVVAVGIGVGAFYLTKLLVILGAGTAPVMLAVGFWRGGPRLARRLQAGLGAGLQSLCCGVPALYLTVRYSSGSVPTPGCFALMVLFMLLWLVRLGYERFTLVLQAESPTAGFEPIDETRLLLGAVLWAGSAGLLVFLAVFPRFRPSTAGTLMPALYLLPFLLGWSYFAGEWVLSAMEGQSLPEP